MIRLAAGLEAWAMAALQVLVLVLLAAPALAQEAPDAPDAPPAPGEQAASEQQVEALAKEVPAPVSPGEHLERGRLCHDNLDMDCAVAELEAASGGADELPPEDRKRLFLLLGRVRMGQGEEKEAVAAFQDLYRADPGFSPKQGALPPEVLSALDRAREGMEDLFLPEITPSPFNARQGRPVEFKVRVLDRSGVGKVLLHVRQRPSDPFEDFPMVTADGESFSAILPVGKAAAPQLEYYVEAWDRKSNGPVELGSSDKPLLVPLLAPEGVEGAWYTSGWFIGAVSAAAVVAGATTWLLLSGDGGGTEGPTEPATGDVRVTWER